MSNVLSCNMAENVYNICVLANYLYCQARKYIMKFNIHAYKHVFV